MPSCHTVFPDYGWPLLTLFMAGLVGGFSHCMGMCGPFVLAQTGKGSGLQQPALGRLKGAALLPYHLGRGTTYALLGVAAALLSRSFTTSSFYQHFASALLVMAGFFFLASSVKGMRRFIPRLPTGRWGKTLGAMAAPLLLKPTGLQGYALGLVLGLLPCGLVLAALMMVMSLANPLLAAFGMLAFTLGTLPALLLVGGTGTLALKHFPRALPILSRTVMAFNAITLFAFAARMVA